MMELLQGRMENYSRARMSENFAIGDIERGALGGVAIAASLAGQAAGTASSSDADEPADFVEFTLNGEQVAGWLWFSPFNEGDEVTAVVRRESSGPVVLALLRPRDRLIALYPHCSRGRFAHWRAVCRGTVKWGSWFVLVVLVLIGLMMAVMDLNGWWQAMKDFSLTIITGFVPLLVLAALVLGWKWMKFVRLAEEIFSALDWADVRNIDLVARSRAAPLDSRVSFLVKDPLRLEEELVALMSKEEAREMRSAMGMTDSDRMTALYGYGYFRY